MKSYRIDAVEITKAERDDQGFLQVGGVIARVGVQEYLIDGQVVRELRREDEVIKSVKTFARKPITLEHPKEFVTSENANEFLKGMTSTVTYQDGLVIDPEMSITHQDAIEAGLSTHKQLSAGYLVDVLPESGTWIDTHGVQGTIGQTYEYDAVQVNIEANHVALVTEARAGKVASLKLDSTEDDISVGINTRMDQSKINIEIQTDDIDMSENIAKNDTAQWLERLDAAKADAREITAKFDALDKEFKELQGKFDATEAIVAEKDSEITILSEKLEASEKAQLNDEAISSEVTARVAMWSLVGAHLDGVEADYSKSVLDIKKLYLSTKIDAAKVADASEDTINGMWLVLEPKNDGSDAPKEDNKEFDSALDAQKAALDALNSEVTDQYKSAATLRAEAEQKYREQLASTRLIK